MITYTRDGKGFLYDKTGKYTQAIREIIFKDTLKNGPRYKETPTMMHFNYNGYRHTIYNKTLCLIMKESLVKKIGIGTKGLFRCSPTMR